MIGGEPRGQFASTSVTAVCAPVFLDNVSIEPLLQVMLVITLLNASKLASFCLFLSSLLAKQLAARRCCETTILSYHDRDLTASTGGVH